MAPKILRRDWQDLRQIWVANTPTATTSTMPRPDPAESLITLQHAIQDYAANKVDILHRDYPDEIIGLREAILLDSIFLLVKASHVLSGAQVHVDHGMCTWSLSSAYQAAFFAMQGVAGLFGISVVEIDSNTYIIDVGTTGDQKATSKFVPPKIMRAMKCQRVEHRQWWGVFLRLVRISSVPEELFLPPLRDRLAELSNTDFASQRNKLHYGNTAWLLDDLLACAVRPNFGVDERLRTGAALDLDRDDFSILLAILLVRLGYQLLADLASVSNALGAELARLDAWLAEGQNALYRQASG